MGCVNEADIGLVELTSGSHSGWGEMPLEGDASWNAILAMSTSLLGQDLLDPASSLPDLNFPKRNLNSLWAREALSVALYDLVGRLEGVSVTTLLGKVKRQSLPGMPVVHLAAPGVMARRSAKWANAGYRHLKIKLRGGIDEDRQALKEIRQRIGDKVAIQVDCNCGYPNLDEAVQAVRELEAFNVEIVEDMFPGDLGAYARLRDLVRPKVMVDNESYWPNIQRIVEMGAADIVNLHPLNQGGLDLALKVDHVAAGAGIPTSIGSHYQLGINNTAFQLLGSVIGCTRPVEDIGLLPYFSGPLAGEYSMNEEPNVLADPLPIEDGCIIIRDAPGLGVNVDRNKLEALLVDDTTLQ